MEWRDLLPGILGPSVGVMGWLLIGVRGGAGLGELSGGTGTSGAVSNGQGYWPPARSRG
jgi:hypothetical protein